MFRFHEGIRSWRKVLDKQRALSAIMATGGGRMKGA